MSRIDSLFKKLREKGESTLIPFIMAGDPDLETTEALILEMRKRGVELIELGLPSPNPLRDGPVMQASHRRALNNGVTLKEILHRVRKLRDRELSLVLMGYLASVLEYGVKSFVRGCKEAGIDGVLIPDYVPQKAGDWIKESREIDLDTIFLIDPESSERWKRWAVKFSRGFIYYALWSGFTGERERHPEGAGELVRRLRFQTRKPIVVGFGISTPEQVREAGRFAEGVVVGSAIVRAMEANLKRKDMVERVGDLASSFLRALREK